ncbi:MAG: Fic family protein [Dehalococcoidia bacterium]
METQQSPGRGDLVPTIGGQQAFIPLPLPAAVDLPLSIIYELDLATRAVATLSGVGETLANPHLLISPFLNREAVSSSAIEGTQASISDLFMFEAASRESPDVREVANYVLAFERGQELLERLPISVRLVNQVHETLMRGVRGGEWLPGEPRKEQVWIGAPGTPIEQARFIPARPDRILDCLADWERFVNEESQLPPLIRCAMMHYQFEAIHPYMDGNGRVGRLLIALFLMASGVLPKPLLYLSAFFQRNRSAYYGHLNAVSASNEWDGWFEFFLKGVTEQANDALLRSRRVRDLHDKYRRRLQDTRAPANALRLLDALFANPYTSAPRTSELLAITPEGARKLLERLREAGILEFHSGVSPRLYVARELLNLIEAPVAV